MRSKATTSANLGFERELWQADHVLASLPFNDSDWRGGLLKDDKRCVYGVPPVGNALRAPLQGKRKPSA